MLCLYMYINNKKQITSKVKYIVKNGKKKIVNEYDDDDDGYGARRAPNETWKAETAEKKE
jgi:ABC-type branched-subunit amino acid transport system substrate-binding protein